MSYKENPKTKGSGIICCIPQTGECPQRCEDCFFQSGRSYLEPLEENLPNIPTAEEAAGRIVRMNDGNDSNVQRDVVIEAAKSYEDVFFNTSIPRDLSGFPGPVVLTVNPARMTDNDYHEVAPSPNLMYVRIRVNTWNMCKVVIPAVEYYTGHGIPVILTFMAYYTEKLPEGEEKNYEWKKRTMNSYWVLTKEAHDRIEKIFENNPLVHTCGHKGTFSCSQCGNCIREYYRTKEAMRTEN